MPTTVLHFEHHLIYRSTIREAAEDALDLVEELQARGRGEVTELDIDTVAPRALVVFRVENVDEIQREIP